MPPNKKAVDIAIMVAKMLGCEIVLDKDIYFQRKHYNYPDLPSGYQRTSVPIGVNEKVYDLNGNEKIFQSLVGRTLNKRGEDYEIFLFNSDLAIIEYDKHGNKISSLILIKNFFKIVNFFKIILLNYLFFF